MAELKIYGHSDDLLEIEGVITKELNVWVGLDKKLYYEIQDDAGDGCVVSVVYNGSWNFNVYPLENKVLPDWGLEIEIGHLYSSMVHFYNCPDELRIRSVGEWIYSNPGVLLSWQS